MSIELWTVEEVAAWLKKSKSWVYRQVAANKLPHRKVGADLRFIPSELEQWILDGASRARAAR